MLISTIKLGQKRIYGNIMIDKFVSLGDIKFIKNLILNFI